MKKRALALLLIATCGIQLAACGKSANDNETEESVASAEEYEESDSAVDSDMENYDYDDGEGKYSGCNISIEWDLQETDETYKDFVASSDGDFIVLTQDNQLAKVGIDGLENIVDAPDAKELVSSANMDAIVKNTDGTYSVYDSYGGKMDLENVSCPDAVGEIKGMYYSADLGLYVYSLDGTQLYLTGTNYVTESWPVNFFERTVDEDYTSKEIVEMYTDGYSKYFVFPDKTMIREQAALMASLEIDRDNKCIGMTVYPTNASNVEKVFCAGISSSNNVAYLDSTDTENLKIDSQIDGVSSVVLPDGYTTADVKEAYFGDNEGCVIFEDGNIYLYTFGDFDTPELAEELTEFYGDGAVKKICSGSENVYFLMDDGKIYEIF